MTGQTLAQSHDHHIDRVWEQGEGGWRLVSEPGPRPWRKLMAQWREESAEQKAFENFHRRRCVLYVVNGRERRSPWLRNLDRTEAALTFVRQKYGNGIIFVD